MDGVGEAESPAHAPRIPYLLGIHGTVWGFGLNLNGPVALMELFVALSCAQLA